VKRLLLLLIALTAAPAQAYEILESRYRVETSPGVLEDQLVLRCDDGRKLTVSWEARLSEACGEVAYPDSAGGGARAESDQAKEKATVLSRVREQNSTIDEHHLQFQPRPDGLEVQFSPQTREILKRYELCRKQTKGSPICASERDQALARLSGPAPVTEAAAPVAQARASKASTKADAVQRRTTSEAVAPETAEPVARKTPALRPAEPVSAIPQAPKPAELNAAEERAAAQQQIAEDYSWCMRAKPRFDCEQERASALKRLDRPQSKARTTTSKVKTKTQPQSMAAH